MYLESLSDCNPKCATEGPMPAGPMSLLDRLEVQKRELEGRLNRVNSAIEALNAHPEVMKVLELVSKV